MIKGGVIMSKKILIIEDEKEINNVLYEYLISSGYEVSQAFDGLEGLMKFDNQIDLVICDVMMPRLNGYGVVEEIRKKSNVSIIMLTALSEEEDILKGYDLGVDEYVSKPFSPKIIVKKVEAILSRQESKRSKSTISKGIISIEIKTMKTVIDENIVSLSKKEFELLQLFMENDEIVFNRDTLLNKIWGYDYFGDDRVVDTCIKRLRKKISPANNYIKTVFGVGYKFEVIS